MARSGQGRPRPPSRTDNVLVQTQPHVRTDPTERWYRANRSLLSIQRAVAQYPTGRCSVSDRSSLSIQRAVRPFCAWAVELIVHGSAIRSHPCPVSKQPTTYHDRFYDKRSAVDRSRGLPPRLDKQEGLHDASIVTRLGTKGKPRQRSVTLQLKSNNS
jgi:hypothetical protein